MSTLEQNVRAAAERHASILRELDALDYASSALSQQESYLGDLKKQYTAAESHLASFEKKVKKERDEHLDIQGSVGSKWAHKLTGRSNTFKKKMDKEEREYMAALEEEHSERAKRDRLAAAMAEAEQTRTELSTANERYKALSAELDHLYQSIFQGPTPDAPQEDEQEGRLFAASLANDESQANLSLESQTTSILSDAHKSIHSCRSALNQARDSSSADVWGVGGSMADMMERSAIGQAQNAASQMEFFMSQARRMNPQVQGVETLTVPRASMGDVYFDNIFSDLAMHDKIKACVQQSERIFRQVTNEVQASSARLESAVFDASQKAEVLQNLRRDLHNIRKATFESIAGSTHGSDSRTKTQLADSADPPPPFPEASPAYQQMPSPPAHWHSMNPYAAMMAGRAKATSNSGTSN